MSGNNSNFYQIIHPFDNVSLKNDRKQKTINSLSFPQVLEFLSAKHVLHAQNLLTKILFELQIIFNLKACC